MQHHGTHRQLVLASLAVLVIAACGSAPGRTNAAPSPGTGAQGTPAQGQSQPPTTPSPGNPGGGSLIGPASARISVDGATHDIDNGLCQALAEGFLVTVGARFMPIDPPMPDFLGLTVEGASAGGEFSGPSVFVSVVLGGDNLNVGEDATVTLAGDLRSGSFSGSMMDGPTATGPISGEFSC